MDYRQYTLNYRHTYGHFLLSKSRCFDLKKYGFATAKRRSSHHHQAPAVRTYEGQSENGRTRRTGVPDNLVACKNCGSIRVPISETQGSRLFSMRLGEHWKGVNNTKNEKYTRSGENNSLKSNMNKFALTDHATTENPIID